MELASGTTGCFVWSAGFDPAPGERECGDGFRFATSGGRTLLAVVDGLGHGPSAVESSRSALEAICESDGTLGDRVRSAHAQLSRLRGGAVGVLSVNDSTGVLEWIGVGNVEAAVHPGGPGKAKWLRLFVQTGLVGQRLPTLRVAETRLSNDAVIVVTTDGIDPALLDDVASDPGGLVTDALSNHRVAQDDALIVAARYVAEVA